MNHKIETAEDAERLRQNPVWKLVIRLINERIDRRLLECPTSNKDLSADIVRYKQIMNDVEREIERLIDQGNAAKRAELKEIMKKPREVIFRR